MEGESRMANPVLARAEVISRTTEGSYRRLVLHAPDAASRVSPGHFAAVACTDSGRLLRRPFWIHRADVANGTIELVVAEHLDVARELVLDLVAPLGTPFPLPDGPISALLVGTGYGSVPLIPLAEEIRRRGGQVGFILGAASEDQPFGVAQAKALTQDVLITGNVTDPLPQAIRALNATVVHACGPMPMLRSVTRIAVELAARCWTAVEQPTACGVGLCMACVLPVIGGDGVSRSVRACTDGPVFDGARIRWSDLDVVA